MRNRFDLPRKPPAHVRRQLRQEAGFGCVKCGYAFCEYEHIDPEYKDASEHDPKKMAFLCRRCHGEVHKRASKDSIWKAKADPFCKRGGKPSGGVMEVGSLDSSIGTVGFYDSRVILRILGDDILSIEEPEEGGGSIRVNAQLYDGPNLSLEIEDNAITLNEQSWDVEVVGSVLTVRRAHREPSLVYRFLPKSGVRVERIDMEYRDIRVVIDGDYLRVGGSEFPLSVIHAMFQGCHTCIDVRPDGVCLGDVADPPVGQWMPASFATCVIGVPLLIPKPARVEVGNCSVRGGIFIENGAQVSIAGGVVFGKNSPVAVK